MVGKRIRGSRALGPIKGRDDTQQALEGCMREVPQIRSLSLGCIQKGRGKRGQMSRVRV